MQNIRYIAEYRSGEMQYHLLAVPLPFQDGNEKLSDGVGFSVSATKLLTSYLDFVKPKGDDCVEDIRIRSDPGVDRAAEGLADAEDITFLAVTNGVDVAASYTIYSSRTDRQIGLVCHVRTHENHRRKGLSLVLGSFAMEEWYGDNPNRVLVLHVTNPPAHRIYKRYGYVTLVGRIADTDQEPGEMMARTFDSTIQVKDLIRERYGEREGSFIRELRRSDIAGFVMIFAAGGKLENTLRKMNMRDANAAEDFFTMTILKRDKSTAFEGIFNNSGILKGVKVYSLSNPDDCEIYYASVIFVK